jgi:hypothetical protein
MKNPVIGPMQDKKYLSELTIETESGFQCAPYKMSDISIEKHNDKYLVKYTTKDETYIVKRFSNSIDANIFREKFSKCLYQAYINRKQSGILGLGRIFIQDIEQYRIT